jgi:hypothetical protein
VTLLRRDRFAAALALAPLVAAILVAAWAAKFSHYNLDLLGYLTPALALMAVVVPAGLRLIETQVKSLTSAAGFAVHHLGGAVMVAGLAFVLVLQASGNYAQVSKRGFRAAERYADALLEALPPDCVFLAGEDNSFLPLLYRQAVDGIRGDVILLSGGALLRPDYRQKTQRRFPQLAYPSDWLDDAYAGNFATKLAEWCGRNTETRPVCMTLSEWTAPLIPHLEPVGFAYRLVGDSVVANAAISESHRFYRHQAELWESCRDLTTREHFGRHLYNHAVYLHKQGVAVGAAEYAAWAAATDSENLPLLINCANLLYAIGYREKADAVAAAIRCLAPGFAVPTPVVVEHSQ